MPNTTIKKESTKKLIIGLYDDYNDLGSYTAVGKKNKMTRNAVRQRLRRGSISGLFPKICRENGDSLEKIKTLYEDYKALGTLQAVGRKNGITRERVRQVLMLGKEMGVCDYQTLKENERSARRRFTRNEVLDVAKESGSIDDLRNKLNLSVLYLKYVLNSLRISRKRLKEAMAEHKKELVVDRYHSLARDIGHPPSTLVIQDADRYLDVCIRKYWGGIQNFRDDVGITTHKHESTFIAEKILKKNSESIMRVLSRSTSPMACKAISEKADIVRSKAFVALKNLVGHGDVEELGSTFNRAYRSVKG